MTCGRKDLGLTAGVMYGYMLSKSSILGPAMIAGLIPMNLSQLFTRFERILTERR